MEDRGTEADDRGKQRKGGRSGARATAVLMKRLAKWRHRRPNLPEVAGVRICLPAPLTSALRPAASAHARVQEGGRVLTQSWGPELRLLPLAVCKYARWIPSSPSPPTPRCRTQSSGGGNCWEAEIDADRCLHPRVHCNFRTVKQSLTKSPLYPLRWDLRK